MDIQLDNHTNIMGLKTGSGSQSADIKAGSVVTTRHVSGHTFRLAEKDKGQQPRQAHVQQAGTLVPTSYISYPAQRGPLDSVRCGGEWVKATPVWSKPANTIALAGTETDVPTRRSLSKDVVLVRLPTFSKENGERLRAAMPSWPGRGEEKIVLVDLRNNHGGDMAPQALMNWITREELMESFKILRTLATSCLYHALRWGYGHSRPLPENMSPEDPYQTYSMDCSRTMGCANAASRRFQVNGSKLETLTPQQRPQNYAL